MYQKEASSKFHILFCNLGNHLHRENYIINLFNNIFPSYYLRNVKK